MNPVNYCFRILVFVLAVLLALCVTPAAKAQRQMEKLGRGLVVLKTSGSNTYVSWRLLATDPDNVSFNLYRSIGGGAASLVSGSMSATTDYLDTPGSAVLTGSSVSYYVKPIIGNVEQAASPTYTLPAGSASRQYLSVPLQPVISGTGAAYDVKFCWVGDFDGDGEYDYLVDRHNSATSGDHQYLQAYKRDGTFLWQMDMGPNSTVNKVPDNLYEPSASVISIGDTDNVTVYDMDGDGKAEVLVRTANGVTVMNSGTNQVASITAANNTTQFVSVINGLTGVEMARTTLPNPWSAYGTLTNKCAIAYLDGVRPSVIFYGYNRSSLGDPGYTTANKDNFYRVFSAFDYRDGALTLRWTNPTWSGEGHQFRIADVDHDGKDEVCDLGFTIDDDGTMLFDTELGHGDRFHITDIDPDRPGMETYAIQQYNSTLLATALYQSSDGSMIRRWYNSNVVDVGRGLAVDMNPDYFGYEMFSTQAGIYDRKGNKISNTAPWPWEGLWWNSDLLREFFASRDGDGVRPCINYWNYSSGTETLLYNVQTEGVHCAYGARPAFFGDILGDWREEFIVVADDYSAIRIYTTKVPATNRLPCLMQNAAYRCQATCKGYYQASYVDYYLGTGMQPPPPALISNANIAWKGDGASNVWNTNNSNWNQSWFTSGTFGATATYTNGQTVLFDITGSNNVPVTLTGTLTPASVLVNTPKPYTFGGTGMLSGTMKLTKSGGGALTLTGTHNYTGATLVAEGPLIVNGRLTSSPVTVRGGVWLDGAISGTGVVGNGAVIQPRGAVSPGNGANSIGTITISGTLAETDAYNRLDLSNSPTGSNDRIAVTGNLSLSGTNILQINPTAGTLTSGTYTLITYTGALTGSAGNLAVRGITGVPYSFTVGSGSVNLIVNAMRSPGATVWAGTSGAWNLATTSSWLKSGTADVFVTGDAVTFTDSGAAAGTVTLADAMLPSSVTVSSGSNYTFGGSGYLSGTTGLVKSGSGTLTINTSNDFTGPVSITGGVLAVSTVSEAGAAGGLGAASTAASNLVINSGTLRYIGSQSVTNRGASIGAGGVTFDTPTTSNLLVWQGALTGSGPFTKSGAGTLILNGSNSYTGVTTISGGVVSLADDTTNQYGLGNSGTGTIVITSGTLKMYDNNESYNNTYWNIDVPAGGNATLLADGRCELRGALTGSGIFNFYANFSRIDLFGSWSAFTGQINVTTDSDGGDFRIQNTNGYANASLDFGPRVNVYYAPLASTQTISLGALSGVAGSELFGSSTNTRTITWSVGAKNSSTTFGGSIQNGSGIAALTKVGTGVLTLTGSSYYTGATLVSGSNGSTLRVDGILNGSNVTVNSGNRLTGTGVIGGSVTLLAGAMLGDGTGSVGTLSIGGGLTLANGGNLLLNLANTTASGGGVNDLFQLTGGALSMSGTITVTPAYLNSTLTTGTYTLITGGTATTGTPTFVWGGTNSEIVSFNTSTPGTVQLVVVGAGPPAAPADLVATAGNAQVTLSWDAVTGATSYKVKRSLTSGTGYALVTSGTTTGTSYTDTGLTNGTKYYYKVAAVNSYGDGLDSAEASAKPVSPITVSFASVAGQDGYVRESNENSDVGNSATSNTVLRIGDDYTSQNQAGERQMKAIVSFDTSSLPDNAVVTSAVLKLKTVSTTGTSPFITHGTCYADIKGELGFSGLTTLVNGDFEAAADATQIAVMSDPALTSGTSTGTLNAAALGWVNKTATTQLRIYFASDDNDDSADNWIDFYAGDDTTAANRPVLIVTYYLDEAGDSPKAWLKFDESNGTTAADSSGNGWNGTLVNTPTWDVGKINNALSLSGSAHATIPTGIVNTLTDFTISTWVKLNSVTNWSRIFDFGTGSTFYMFLTPSNGITGKVRFAITTTGGAGEQLIDGASALTSGTWTHVAVTLSGSTGTLYVSGTAAGTHSAMTLKPVNLGNTTLNYIGRSQFAADPYLDGLVDDFRIYNRALSAAEVSGLVAPPTITSVASATGTNGSAFSYAITATNSPVSYGATGLPAGLSVATGTGVISGTPTVTGTFNATISAVNASGTGNAGLTITLLPAYTALENWRMTNFGTTANTGDAADTADPDGDGSTNAREFMAGTDPKNRGSVLKINEVQASGNNMVVSFATVVGKTYRVESSTTLQSGSWTTVQDNIAGTGGTVQITDTNGALQPKRFYRLYVQ